MTLDFETTTHMKGRAVYPENKIVLACWAHGYDGTVRTQWGGEFDQKELVDAVAQADFIVAHNAKFELQWLARCGLDLHNVVVFDTMIGEYVLAGNVLTNLSLDAIAEARLGARKMGVVSSMIKAGISTEDVPTEWLETYCRRDVELTRRLLVDQLGRLDEQGLLHIQYARCLATPVFADIESNGMQLDVDLVRTKFKEVEEEYNKVTAELDTLMAGINPNSAPQRATFLYDTMGFKEPVNWKGEPVRTGKGGRKTDADTVAKLKAKTKAQQHFLDVYTRQRELNSELTKYLRKFYACVEENGGVLTAEFNQCRTQTHRLSSSGLTYKTQFQNLPRVYKPLFRAARKGWLMGEADGAQLEFRVAAHLGRDVVALADIEEGRDVHSATAEIIGVTRQDAKAHTFKPLYGGQSGTKKEVEYYDYFKDRYKGIANAQREWINEVLGAKKLRTEYGLVYHWPDTRMSRSGYVNNTTSICNYPVQGFATAEIIPLALVYMWHMIHAAGLKMRIVNTVHDSIIAELPPEEEEVFKVLARVCLIDRMYEGLERLYNVKFTVPLGCGVKVAEHWGTGKEFKYDAPQQLYKEIA